MELNVNGEEIRLYQLKTINDLLKTMSLTEQRVAVEVNGEIIPRSQHDNTRLSDGDAIEIVRAIGGG
ncbi:MAG: sulfur carrier protein ThiS [Motiliproteus sp.]|nr:sulfur carrier protein ThiS [Motiliproteus sp.]